MLPRLLLTVVEADALLTADIAFPDYALGACDPKVALAIFVAEPEPVRHIFR